MTQAGRVSVNVFARSVSVVIDRTVASCHRSGAVTSVPAVALLFPRVATPVIAERFPEAQLVVIHQAKSSEPLGALPEIQMRHHQSRRAAMLRGERLAIVG